jgi:hypothetical protein
LLIRAVDAFMQHGPANCEADPCPRCDVTINQLRLAYKVWQNSAHQSAALQHDERAEALRSLEWIREFAEAHHGQQPANVWLHSLTIDVPHYLDYVLELLTNQRAEERHPEVITAVQRYQDAEARRQAWCTAGKFGGPEYTALLRERRHALQAVLAVDLGAEGRQEPEEKKMDMEQRRIAAYRMARIFEPSMDGYAAGMAVYNAAFPEAGIDGAAAVHISDLTARVDQRVSTALWAALDVVREHVGEFDMWPLALKVAFSAAIIDTSPATEADIQRTHELAKRFGWERVQSKETRRTASEVLGTMDSVGPFINAPGRPQQLIAEKAKENGTSSPLSAEGRAPTEPPSARDVCAKCGHYRETHGERCHGWMPAGTGHTKDRCECLGFEALRPWTQPTETRQEEP